MTTWAEFHAELTRIEKERAFAETQWYSCFERKNVEDPLPSESARKALCAISWKAQEAREAALNALLATPESDRGPRE
jgi:hypothetical protein